MNGTAYQAGVRAVNSVGEGPWSASATGTPVAATDDRDRAVLMEFYNATNRLNWVNNDNWGSSVPLGQWYGVTTDASGRVTLLSLEYNISGGSIPSSLGSLTKLEHLFLSGNDLSGSIPSSPWQPHESGDLAS